MLTDAMIIGAAFVVALLLVWRRVRRNVTWRATTTPLASIIGSGFLVLGPLLNDSFGAAAPLVMLALCAAAYVFGAAVRRNMRAMDQGFGLAETRIDTLSSWVLAFAYVVSVAYYLNLFGAFGLSLFGLENPDAPRILTTVVYLVILLAGLSKGFRALESMEQVSVGLKLAVIAGLIVGLAGYVGAQIGTGSVAHNPVQLTGWPAVTLVFGLIVTVQGFETSRYLGATYDTRTRIRSMIVAQVLATAIYLVYVGLLSIGFPSGGVVFSETAIIDMMGQVASVLPYLLVLAALAAQFSAAVADTGGAGGLVTELTKGRLPERQAYAVLVAVGVAMTWGLDVFAIIAVASRAFALYYALQALQAAFADHRDRRPIGRALFFCLAVFGLVIAIFGRPFE